MGAIAAKSADRVIVTDDNPRSENPAAIRAAIMDGASRAPNVREIGDRREAIRGAVAALKPGDVLLVAGKGHETGQIVGSQTLDVQRPRGSRSRAPGEGGMSVPLWTVEAMAKATGATPQGALPQSVPGLSIDTRTVQPGEAFFALKDVRDGHDFVEAALKAGGGWPWSPPTSAACFRRMRRCWWCPTCWKA